MAEFLTGHKGALNPSTARTHARSMWGIIVPVSVASAISTFSMLSACTWGRSKRASVSVGRGLLAVVRMSATVCFSSTLCANTGQYEHRESNYNTPTSACWDFTVTGSKES